MQFVIIIITNLDRVFFFYNGGVFEKNELLYYIIFFTSINYPKILPLI